MFRVIIFLLIGGGFLAFMGFQEWQLGSGSQATPTPITLAELEVNGPGDNAHILITDFVLVDNTYVYEERENKPVWTKIWIPAAPFGGAWHRQLDALLDEDGRLTGEPPMPETIKVIVKSSHIRDEDQLYKDLVLAETMQGMIMNKIESLGSEEKQILIDNYPGVNFDDVYIFEHGREPAGAGKTFGLLGGGIALVAVGLGLGAKSMLGDRSAAEPAV